MSVGVEVSTCRLGLLGFGRVGQAVAALASASSRLIDRGVDARVVTALVRDPEKPRAAAPAPLCTSPERFFDQAPDVVIEVMGGVDPAYDHVRRALESGIPVVTANKSLMAAKGAELRAVAAGAGTALAYDAAVLAGVPFIGALARRPFAGALRRITGILNGTSHFLACALATGRPFDRALEEAIERGYAEPDSSADVSGRDAAEKLTILLQLAGCGDANVADLPVVGLDALRPVDFGAARALGGAIKPVATASLDPRDAGAWVGPALVDEKHPAAAAQGVHNFVEFDSDAAGSDDGALPVTFAGPGAGPHVTAATILDDVAEVLAGAWTPLRAPARRAVAASALRQPPRGGWYLRLSRTTLDLADVVEHLSSHHAPALRAAPVWDSVAVRTMPAPWAAVQSAAEAIRACGADVRILPVIEARR